VKTRMADWSRWQGSIAPGLLSDAGIDGAWLKASGSAPSGAKPADPFFIDPFFTQNAGLLKNYNAVAKKPLILGAFAYLVPGYAEAQAALFHSLLLSVGGPYGWAIKVDVEQVGLTADDVDTWYRTWGLLSRHGLGDPPYPTVIYTQKSKWKDQLHLGQGNGYTPLVEEARWVESAKRVGAPREQERGIYADWWDLDYGGWSEAFGLQYTDSAVVGSATTTCTLYWCTPDMFQAQLVR
jgi:hypothetical protein